MKFITYYNHIVHTVISGYSNLQLMASKTYVQQAENLLNGKTPLIFQCKPYYAYFELDYNENVFSLLT